jgi:iron(III) transport system permease protein
VLFYGTVLVGTFVRTWGLNYEFTLSTLNMVLQGWSSMKNSIVLATWGGAHRRPLGMGIAYLTYGGASLEGS